MNVKKIIALSLATLSLLTLLSCGEKVCHMCKKVPPTHSIKSSKKVELCDYCYQRAVMTETDSDVEGIKSTSFEALTDKQKNYIVIFVEERFTYYDSIIGEPVTDELTESIYTEASKKYDKTVDQIKSLFDAHKTRGEVTK